MAKHLSSGIQSHRIISLGFALLLAMAGLFIYALPGGFALEEDIALDFLFKQRHQIPPPESVMLVSIDKAASHQLNLPNDPNSWPRDLHARLIDRLDQAGAAVIVFDVFFREANKLNMLLLRSSLT